MAAVSNAYDASQAVQKIIFLKQQLDSSEAAHADLLKRSKEVLERNDDFSLRIFCAFWGMGHQSAQLKEVLRIELGDCLEEYEKHHNDSNALIPSVFEGSQQLAQFKQEYKRTCAKIPQIAQEQMVRAFPKRLPYE